MNAILHTLRYILNNLLGQLTAVPEQGAEPAVRFPVAQGTCKAPMTTQSRLVTGFRSCSGEGKNSSRSGEAEHELRCYTK